MALGALGLSIAWLLALGAPQAAASSAQELDLTQLDRVTAGSAASFGETSGGAIAANDSEVQVSRENLVEVDGAQGEARALNLVNAAGGAVATPMNVLDARFSGEANGAPLPVDQANLVDQYIAPQSAALPEFKRLEAAVHEVSSSVGSESSSSASSTTTNTTNEFTSTQTQEGQAIATVSTGVEVLGQQIQPGKGIAGSGSLEAELDGGRIQIAVGASASVGSGIDDGLIEGGIDATISGTLDWELPEIRVAFDGSICAVQLGSCEADGTNTTTTSSTDLVVEEFFTEESASFSSEWDEALDLTIRPPFFLSGAQAELIAVDDSRVEASVNNSVVLTGGAQQGARGINIVNASGSLVATPANIARVNAASGPVPNVTQTNSVVQIR